MMRRLWNHCIPTRPRLSGPERSGPLCDGDTVCRPITGGFSRRITGGFCRRNHRRVARRDRRGLSVLTATLLVSLSMALAFAGFASSEALRLRDAQATRLEQWTRQEARALHLWLHEAQGKAGFRLPAPGGARPAGDTGGSSRRSNGNPPAALVADRAPWASPPRGFSAQYAIANPATQANNPDKVTDLMRAHGILIVSVGDPDAVDGNHRYLLTALCQALAPSQASVMRAEALAKRALPGLNFGGPGCDIDRPGRAVALFAAPLSGIDPQLVLRGPRSGFAPAVMQTALRMGGHALSDVANMTVPDGGGIETQLLATQAQGGAVDVSGNLTVEGGFSAGHLRARSAQVPGRLDVKGQLITASQADSRLDVTGALGDSRAVRTMTLSGPGPVPGVRPLSVRRCSPSQNCGGRRSGANHGN